MKLNFLIIFLSSLQLSAKTFSQETLSVNLKHATLSEALKQVERKSHYRFVYSNMILPSETRVTLSEKNIELNKLLDKLLENTGLRFRMMENNLVVINSPDFLQAIITVSGRVTDSKGTPLANVSISVDKSHKGTTTNENGEFSIQVDENAVLHFSFVGYESQSVNVGGKTTLQVVLQESPLKLSDVVVVGYGSARKRDVTGAIASVSPKDFNQGIISNPVQQIEGKVAGLVITQPGGDPNQVPIIRLRGQTSLTGGQTPLFVVDGVPLDDASQIVNIPPGDIASYDILKDASATAIYGSRGANGVIIVNTKKGHAGKTQVDYAGSIGVDRIAKKFDLLNASEYKTAAGVNGASYDKGGNTDWMDAITRTAFTQSHNLAISGGTGNFNYRASGTYINQQGIVINTGKEETGLRLNAEQKALRNKLDIQVGVVNSITNRKYVDNNIFLYVLNTPPTYPVYNADGSYYGYYDFDEQNPVAQQELQTNKAKEKFSQLYGTANYEIIKGLKAGVTGSISNFDLIQDFFQPSLPLGPGNSLVNNGFKSSENRYSKKGDIHINYIHDWNRHNLAVTLVHEYSDFTYERFKASGSDFLLDPNGNNSLENGNSSKNLIESYKEEYELASFLGRVAYNYDSKYYVTASLRRDGSSKFGANNRWGNFPSISAAWRLSQEKFLQDVSWIDELKISLGYGVTGNQDAIDPYRTLLLLGSAGRYYDPSNASNQYPQSYTPVQNANPDLKWEERHGKNIGLDFSFFHRISGNINVYNDKTKNLLFNYTVPVPPNFVNNVLANVGELTNEGVEIQLNADIVKNKNFSWSLGGQITFLKTKITSLSGTWAGTSVNTDDIGSGVARGRGLDGGFITFLKVGYAPYVFYIPHFTGVDKDGNQLFESPAGPDHDINNANRYYYDPNPKFNYGINNTFTYKKLSLNVFIRGVSGQKLFNNTRLLIDNPGRLPSNNVTKESLTNGIKDNTPVVSDLWLQNASYLRLDNATLSYTFGKLNGIENLSVYLTANDLFVITPYKGLDPEVMNGGDDNSYIDYNYGGVGYYPKTRSFVLGVNISFK
jgi:iron complex outermembrane receptor protein